MPFNPEIRQFIGRALADGIAFAVYRMPGDLERLVTDDRSTLFTVNPWRGLSSGNIVIGRDGGCTIPDMPSVSTDHDTYVADIEALVARLRRRGGKTVISRVAVGDAHNIDWARVAEELFDAFPHAFCHLFYTPRTGAWLGATPEVLLDIAADGRLSTMALAGTVAADSEWDAKNRDEHRIVVDYIVDRLQQLGCAPEVGDTGSLPYAAIKHLYTPVSGLMPDHMSAARILDVLSPTPAVAGYPCDDAFADIAAIERHERGCYAGYVAVTDPAGTHAYVNLRCVRFDPAGRYCIYAGGGITADSDAETEWRETEAKSRTLLDIINRSEKVVP